MKSHYIKIYIFHLRKYRYKESILLLQNYILCYLKILQFCELSSFMKSYYIDIYFRFPIHFFLTL